MKQLLLATLLLAPLAAHAQPAPQQPSPVEEALQQRLGQLTIESVNWQTQAIAMKRQDDADKATIADLQKKLDEATKPKTAAPRLPPVTGQLDAAPKPPQPAPAP